MEMLLHPHGKIGIRRNGVATALPYALADIAAMLAPFPPTDAAWENAVMTVEDGIAPLAPNSGGETLAAYGADVLQLLPHETRPDGIFIAADTLETAFAVLAGYRQRYVLPPLPHTAEAAAQVLLLREVVHHLTFDGVLLPSEKP